MIEFLGGDESIEDLTPEELAERRSYRPPGYEEPPKFTAEQIAAWHARADAARHSHAVERAIQRWRRLCHEARDNFRDEWLRSQRLTVGQVIEGLRALDPSSHLRIDGYGYAIGVSEDGIETTEEESDEEGYGW